MPRNRSVAVTVDLDYWWCGKRVRNWKRSLRDTLFSLFDKNDYKPIQLYQDHHHVLPDLNKTTHDHLINIDYHDDIMANTRKLPRKEDLNCGTWVSYVKWRRKANYTWLKPSDHNFSREEGRCCDDNIWEDTSLTDWKNVNTFNGLAYLDEVLTDDSVRLGHISVIASPNYTHHDVLDYFCTLLRTDFTRDDFILDKDAIEGFLFRQSTNM